MFKAAIDNLEDEVIEEDATIAILRNTINNMLFSNFTKYDKVLNEAYTCTVQDILEMGYSST